MDKMELKSEEEDDVLSPTQRYMDPEAQGFQGPALSVVWRRTKGGPTPGGAFLRYGEGQIASTSWLAMPVH
jgi:hypothetical protein